MHALLSKQNAFWAIIRQASIDRLIAAKTPSTARSTCPCLQLAMLYCIPSAHQQHKQLSKATNNKELLIAMNCIVYPRCSVAVSLNLRRRILMYYTPGTWYPVFVFRAGDVSCSLGSVVRHGDRSRKDSRHIRSRGRWSKARRNYLHSDIYR